MHWGILQIINTAMNLYILVSTATYIYMNIANGMNIANDLYKHMYYRYIYIYISSM